MRRLTPSGFVFALVSVFSACRSGGTAPLGGQSAGGATAETGGGSAGTAVVAGSPGAGRGGIDPGIAGSAGAGAGGASTSRPARVLLYSFSTLSIPSVPAQLDLLGQKLAQWHFEVHRSV